MNNARPYAAERIEALTSLRFFAAFIVVTFHFARDTSLVHAVPGIFTSGAEMVTLFFVLSGFVLTLVYAEKKKGPTSEYLLNRVARIAPAYYLALTLVLLLDLRHGASNVDPLAVLLNATFLQSWFPVYAHTVNVPAWSLSVECAFYLVFPLLLWVALRMRLRNLMLLALLLWLVTQSWVTYWLNTDWYKGYPSVPNALLFFFPPMHLCSFILGIAGARLLGGFSKVEQPRELWSCARTLGIFVLVLWVLAHRQDIAESLPVRLPVNGSLLSPLFLLLILQLALGHDRLARSFSLPAFVVLGQASYSFYILQVPVYRIFSKGVGPYLPNNADVQFWTFAAVLTALAILSHRFIEVPAAKAIRGAFLAKPLPRTSEVTAPVTNNNIAT